MYAKLVILTGLITACLFSGCSTVDSTTGATLWGSHWKAKPVTVLEGFSVPECALYYQKDNRLYVSNVASKPEEYWTDDGKGYISAVNVADWRIVPRWLDSSSAAVLNAPKGMCLLDGYLYFTDNTRLLRCFAATGSELEVVAEGFLQANDLATDGKTVWLSDTLAGKVFSITPEGDNREIPAPKGVNGITFAGDDLYAVSWDLHDLFKLDPKGKKQPEAFGLASHFTNLDGIEVMPDGAFIVSDFYGNTVSAVTADRTEVYTLAELETPADIGIDARNKLLYVPQFKKHKLAVYRLIYDR